ncbi:MAG: choice-of-anchor D domain-containing protein, partial [Bdellovibrionales bacterium]|nr:choice-of-anchor D domain-containing protein [Bdellovibrionales bacterium]
AGGLVAGGSCNVVLKFTSSSAGSSSAKLNYVYNNQISDLTVSSNLNAVSSEEVKLVASASTVDFGTVYVGDLIPEKIVTLKYYGDSAWTNSVSIAAPFKVTPVNCGGKSDCQLKIQYVPTAAGTSSSVAQFTYDPALDEVGSINLNLKGNALTRLPALSVTPTSLAKTLIGKELTQVITVKNTGNADATNIEFDNLVNGLSFAKDGGPGTVGHCSVGQTLKMGESCTVIVSYLPTKVGATLLDFNIFFSNSQLNTKLSVTGTKMIQVFAGGFQTCIINELGNPVCWGRNTSGQLGQGSKEVITKKPFEISSIKFNSSVQVNSMAVGDSHTCAIVNTDQFRGRVVCWGSNENGRLGIGETTANVLQPTNSNAMKLVDLGYSELGSPEEIAQIAAGFEHTCALTTSGKVKCWGGNTSGQLGYDNKEAIGLSKSSMTNLQAVNLGRRALSISSGAGHSCAVLDNGATKCWGDNFYGQLGAGSEVEKIGVLPNEMANLNEINLGLGFLAKNIIASNGAFTCALAISGEVKCFGKAVANEASDSPFFGVLGNCWARSAQNAPASPCNNSTQRKPASSLGFLSTDMGDTLGKVSLTSQPSTDIALGSNFSCALSSDGDLKCWGINEQGQLGLGGITNVGESVAEMSGLKSALTNVDKIATGYEHACAVMKNNTLKCWGSSFQNANGLVAFGNFGASVVPSDLPIIYDGR